MTKTKQEIFDFFDGVISKSAIRNIDGEFMVVGHKCQIALEEDDLIDVWIHNTKDISAGLGAWAVRNRLNLFISESTDTLVELNGEGYARGRVKDIILNNTSALGIKKKRNYSQKALEEKRLRMKKLRSTQ
jgi:hypothetical protein